MTSTFGSGTADVISKYAYLNDTLARRTSVVRTGAAFAGGSGDHLDLWSYDDRNEIAHSERYASTQPANPTNPVHDLDRHFAYDPIGNRTSSKIGDSGDPNVPSSSYAANNVNQYTMIGFVSPLLQQKTGRPSRVTCGRQRRRTARDRARPFQTQPFRLPGPARGCQLPPVGGAL